MLPSLIDPFAVELYRFLIETIDSRAASLIGGGATDYASYKQQTGYIEALTDIMGHIEQMEKDRYGPRPGAKEGQE